MLTLLYRLYHFNSQPHEEADDGQSIDADIVSISTHSLTRRLTNDNVWFGREEKDFNSQPHEEADNILRYFLSSLHHFNSQPHEEADIGNFTNQSQTGISTHSLTRRLTLPNPTFFKKIVISTHSLTRRLTKVGTT